MPMSPMDATTQLRSAVAASSFAAEAARCVDEAVEGWEVVEDVEGDVVDVVDVGSSRLSAFSAAAADAEFDEAVEDAVAADGG